MTRLAGKHALLKMFNAEGVRYVFGNPGTSEAPMMAIMHEYPALEYVLGPAALNGTFVDQIQVRVGQPRLFSDVVPATGQMHCLSVVSAPGPAGIYVSTTPALISTPIGDLYLDPASALPLIQGFPGGDSLLTVCIPLPPDPSLIGTTFIHQALGFTDTGALLLSNPAEFTITN